MARTAKCESVEHFIKGGYLRGGKIGQLQLARAIGKQFLSCVPPKDRWRATVEPAFVGKSEIAYVFIMYYTGPLTKKERERRFEQGEGDSLAERANADIAVDRNLHVKFSLHGGFPVQYLDTTMRSVEIDVGS